MGLSIKQKNNSCTGIKLAAELESSEANLRKFIIVHGYVYDEFGKKNEKHSKCKYFKSNIF